MVKKSKFRKLAMQARIRAPKSNSRFRTSFSEDDFFTLAHLRYPGLDTDLRFAFFSHNKVAQTSINRHLLRHRAIVRKDSIAVWNDVLKRQEALWQRRQPFVFTIVRNPYTRAMSAFFYLQKIGKIPASMNLETFIVSILAKEGTEFDPHFMPQERFPKPILQMGFDAVIRIEELQQRWSDVAGAIHAPNKLPQENTTRQSKKPSDLSTEANSVIEELYRNDFEQLGYDRIGK